MDQLVLLIRGALDADNMVGLKLNVEQKNLQKVLTLLTALKNRDCTAKPEGMVGR